MQSKYELKFKKYFTDHKGKLNVVTHINSKFLKEQLLHYVDSYLGENLSHLWKSKK